MDVGLALADDQQEEMNDEGLYDVVIVGGGLAGLICAGLLAESGCKIVLIEKKNYPFHKVCGEYVSNEVLDFLQSIGFDPFQHGAASISKLRISSPQGKNTYIPLDPGGFGLSRYVMDHKLANLACKKGAELVSGVRVNQIEKLEEEFQTSLDDGRALRSRLVIGSYGKRDLLDKKLGREFMHIRSGYMAVKYHLRASYPLNEIGLDNFEGGYCGVVKIEEDKFNLCYLYRRNSSSAFNSVSELEEKILFKNPLIKKTFSNASFIHEGPEVISEISFRPKRQIEDHILMCGDSAGLITPLCGNGMAMAIRAGRMLSELIIQFDAGRRAGSRELLERSWEKAWRSEFASRLRWGRRIQAVFGKPAVTDLAIRTIHAIPPIERYLVSKTHGRPMLRRASFRS